MVRIKITKGETKKFKVSVKDLMEKSLVELVEEKIGKTVSMDNIKLDENTVEILSGDVEVLEIDEQDLIKNSIEQLVKKVMNVRTLKNVKIEIIGSSVKK